mgnify:FL=1
MRKLVLIGYMGAGKSTIGQALSKRMQILFSDTDTLIEEKQGRCIADIFAQDGEDYFRELETNCLKELLEQKEDRIVSTGGGLPLRKENQELLRQIGCTIYLQVSKETVLKRLEGDKNRPLLQVADREAKIADMIQIRHPIYLETADITIAVDGRKVKEIVEEIENLLLNGNFGKK